MDVDEKLRELEDLIYKHRDSVNELQNRVSVLEFNDRDKDRQLDELRSQIE